MKTFLMPFAAIALFAAPAAAQSEILKHDSTVDFTSRGFGGNIDGWCCERYSVRNHLGGIPDIVSWTTVMQDQNCATLQNFRFVLFNEKTTAGYSQPDETSTLADTGFFTAPSGSSGPCAWIFNTAIPTPLAGPFPSDIYTGAWLGSNAAWTADGPSSQISIVGLGLSPEFPSSGARNNYPPSPPNPITNPFGDAGAAYGVNIQPAGTGAVTYPGSWRTWVNRPSTSLKGLSRAYALDTNGVYPDPMCGAGAVGPRNLGMAGHFPDLVNTEGCPAPGRYDDLGLKAIDNGIGGLGFMIGAVARTLARDTLGRPIVTGEGICELNLDDPLFRTSLSDLSFRRPWVGSDIDLDVVLGAPGSFQRLTVALFIRRLYWQAFWVDVASGQITVGSLASAWIIR